MTFWLFLIMNKTVRSLKPDFQALGRFGGRGVLVSAKGEEVDFVSRCFFPNAGINEDPVTGSAHTTMTPYWSKELGKTDLVAKQLSKRGGQLHCKFAKRPSGHIGLWRNLYGRTNLCQGLDKRLFYRVVYF